VVGRVHAQHGVEGRSAGGQCGQRLEYAIHPGRARATAANAASRSMPTTAAAPHTARHRDNSSPPPQSTLNARRPGATHAAAATASANAAHAVA